MTDHRGGYLGQALWSPESMISLRFLTAAKRSVGPWFWRRRLEAAARLRRRLAPDANAFRLVHAEGDGLPSLIVDRYGDVLVAQLLSAGLESRRDEVIAGILEVFEPAGLLLRNDVPVRRLEGLPLGVEHVFGDVPEHVEVVEGHVRYLAAPWTGQKTGAFLDQRENRMRAGDLARGRALDCFCYHGSFALHLARGAREVVAVDSSGDALQRAEENAALNDAVRPTFVEANVFDFLRAEVAEGARYDTIVVDPPAFAKRKDAVDKAIRGYKEINLQAMQLLSRGGILCTFSCSHHVDRAAFHEMLRSAAADSRRLFRWLEWRSAAPDHPEIVQIPETGYLKGAILQAV